MSDADGTSIRSFEQIMDRNTEKYMIEEMKEELGIKPDELL